MSVESVGHRRLTSRIVEKFLSSHLSLLLFLAAMLAGVVALIVTPREEEPQIIVPFADVFVRFPGATAEEVEKLVATPLESKLWEIDGVEYVYSMSRPGEAVATVRFYVGEDRERSLVKVWNKLMSNQDAMPPGVTSWIVKPVEIDDVPIVLFTLWSPGNRYGTAELRRLADELLDKLARVPNTGRSFVVGGEPRRISVYVEPARLAAHGISLLEVIRSLQAGNMNVHAGRFERGNREVLLEVGPFFRSAQEVEHSVIQIAGGKPILLRDVARVVDGPREVESYTRIGFGPAFREAQHLWLPDDLERAPRESWCSVEGGFECDAVTIAVAKRKGTNAVRVAEQLIEEAKAQRGILLPDDVVLTVTRNYGETANHKVNELVEHLLIAVATILVLLAIALGPKESFIVALAVPMTLAVTLILDWIFGYTINRVTLFALILSLGLLVDDPIVDVENIYRHFQLRREPPFEATLTAVDEVRPPVILATFTVIVSFLPMFFITGMMGPYMAPMAFNVPVAMLVSLVVAFTVTPWASYHLLKSEYGHTSEPPFEIERTAAYRWYRKLLYPLLTVRRWGSGFLWAVGAVFVLSALLAVTRLVPLKMLPFDNKNELALVIDMPRGTTLESTDAVARALGAYLATVPEVTEYTSYVGVPSPMDFNGMVRHYYLRAGSHLADVRISLLPKERRQQQSHEIALRIRPDIERISRRFGANVKIVEVPPGPPVISTLVAEVYGPLDASNAELIRVAKEVRKVMEQTPGVVDVDDFAEAAHEKTVLRVVREKAALNGVSVSEVARTLEAAVAGLPVARLQEEDERLPLLLEVRVPRPERTSLGDLLSLPVRGQEGSLVPLSELVAVEDTFGEATIFHKNLRRVQYVIGEMAGRSPVEAVIDLYRWLGTGALPEGYRVELAGEGEWKITVDVFRDLGLAFGAALVMIYVLLVAQTHSLLLPLIIMIAIPLTIIGIMPGFWLLNLLFTEPVGPYPNPIFFTATGMIGMIALAGIVVRNSIILIDFIEHIRARDPNRPLTEVIIEAGATRLRPIFLTAGAAMFGSVVITLDPIFSGLAWSFIFGISASTMFTLVVVPLVYYRLHATGDSPPA
jgi:multidrug efflux pump subunit AcrB